MDTTFAGADSQALLSGMPPEVAHWLQQRDNGVQPHGFDVPNPDVVRHLLALGRNEVRVGTPRHAANANLWVLLPARGISELALQTLHCHPTELAS
jgi:glycerophosphoryl diester phosphodiesterase